MAINSVSGNVNNGSLEKAVQGDSSMTKATTGGAIENAGSDVASKPTNTGDIWANDPSKKLPIGDDLFE